MKFSSAQSKKATSFQNLPRKRVEKLQEPPKQALCPILMSVAKKQNPKDQEKAITRAELEALRQKAATLASEKPEKAALILSLWIHSGKKPKSPKTRK